MTNLVVVCFDAEVNLGTGAEGGNELMEYPKKEWGVHDE